MSEIKGNGYGDKHDWKYLTCNQWSTYGGGACSKWKCKECNEIFFHYYHDIPDIFIAMKYCGVKNECFKNES